MFQEILIRRVNVRKNLMKTDLAGYAGRLIWLSLLAACAPFGKQAPLQETAAYQLPQRPAGAAAAVARWWQGLNDSKLNRLIDQALSRSPDLHAVQARLQQAQALSGMTEAAGKTQIGLAVQGIGLYTSPKPASARLDTNHQVLLGHAALQAGWVFDFWGKQREQTAAVLGQENALHYEAAHIGMMLANAVATQYFAWQSLMQQQNLQRQRMAAADKSYRLLADRVAAGLMPADSLLPLEAARLQLETELSTLAQQAEKARHGLAVLAGMPPYELQNEQPNGNALAEPEISDGLYADTLASRPDIAAQKALLESKFHLIKATEAEFYPNIELKLLAGLSHIDAFDVVRGRHATTAGIAPALHLPIFTSGALQAKLAGKRAEYNEQVAVYDRTVLNAMRAVADAAADYRYLKSRQALWQKMLQTARKELQNAEARRKAGLDNGLNVLKKQDKLLALQMEFARYRAERLAAWSNLNAQSGGGLQN